MSIKVLLHGVPDTPALWGPLLETLNLPETSTLTPALPGFGCALPNGFDCSKEAYVHWFIRELEHIYESSGPSDLVGHDWGALIVIRTASLRPDLVRTWAVANALPDPNYQWHRMARLWQTPLIGELIMALIKPSAMSKAFRNQGVPQKLAELEAAHFNSEMKKAILKLYRSAKNVGQEWNEELSQLPATGLIFWGKDDPYIPAHFATSFAARRQVPLKMQEDTGHWSVVERAAQFASCLKDHWD